MALLKGIERCEYISGVMDNIHYIIWVKDKDDNLIFANKTAFELFKKFSDNDSIECPVETNNSEKNGIVELKFNDNSVWLEFSILPVYQDGYDCILVLANDITESKNNEIKLSKILDGKIIKWKEEKEERFNRLRENNQEMYAMLNLTDNGTLYDE